MDTSDSITYDSELPDHHDIIVMKTILLIKQLFEKKNSIIFHYKYIMKFLLIVALIALANASVYPVYTSAVSYDHLMCMINNSCRVPYTTNLVYIWATDSRGNAARYLEDTLMNIYRAGRSQNYNLIIEPCIVCGNVEGQLRSVYNVMKTFPDFPKNYVISVSKNMWYALSEYNQEKYDEMLQLTNTTFGKYPAYIITSSLDWYDIFYPNFIPKHYLDLIVNYEVSKVTAFGPWVDKESTTYQYYATDRVIPTCNQTSIREILKRNYIH